MALASIPFWSGKNATFQLSLNDKTLEIDVTSCEVSRVGTEVVDHVCGEQRSRNQFIIDHYKVNIEYKEQRLAGLQALLDEQANLDQNAEPFEGWIGILIKPNDGTRLGLMGRGMCVDGWSFKIPGRTERNSGTLPLRFDDIQGLPTL